MTITTARRLLRAMLDRDMTCGPHADRRGWQDCPRVDRPSKSNWRSGPSRVGTQLLPHNTDARNVRLRFRHVSLSRGYPHRAYSLAFRPANDPSSFVKRPYYEAI